MARIEKPTAQTVPGVMLSDGLNLLVPIDLPEGGLIQVIVGHNPLAQPVPTIPVPPGWMVAYIPPEAAQHLREPLNKASAMMQNPHMILPAGSGFGKLQG